MFKKIQFEAGPTCHSFYNNDQNVAFQGPSNLQSGSTRGRTDSNYQASKKDKGKGIAIPKLKNKAIPELQNKANSIGIKFKELPQTNACPQEECNIPNQQIESSLVNSL